MTKSVFLPVVLALLSATLVACGGQQMPPDNPGTGAAPTSPSPEGTPGKSMKGDAGTMGGQKMPEGMKMDHDQMPMDKK